MRDRKWMYPKCIQQDAVVMICLNAMSLIYCLPHSLQKHAPMFQRMDASSLPQDECVCVCVCVCVCECEYVNVCKTTPVLGSDSHCVSLQTAGISPITFLSLSFTLSLFLAISCKLLELRL